MTTTVRKDRKFWVSLELHREINRVMQEQPEFVRERGLLGVEKTLPVLRGPGYHMDLIEKWRNLLERRDWRQLQHHLTSDDEESVEMRNVTVFLGVIPQDRRNKIVDDVWSRPELVG